MTTFGSSGTRPRDEVESFGHTTRKKGKRQRGNSQPIAESFEYSSGLICTLDIPASTASTFQRAELSKLIIGPMDHIVSLPRQVAKRLRTYLTAKDNLTLDELIQELTRISEHTALSRIVALVNKHDYPVQKVKDKLLRDGYKQSVVESVIEKACAGNLLNDERYADVFIRSSINKGVAQAKIAKELEALSIPISGIKGWPDSFFTESEQKRAHDLLAKRTTPDKNSLEKFARLLIRKGYSSSLAYEIARSYLNECSN